MTKKFRIIPSHVLSPAFARFIRTLQMFFNAL